MHIFAKCSQQIPLSGLKLASFSSGNSPDYIRRMSMLKFLRKFGPFHYFSAGGLTTLAVLRGIKYLAGRSSTVEKTIQKGFDVVEDKIDDLKGRVLPDHKKESARAH